ncbi:MAG: transcription-repair coupling factor, partial [Pseudomonadota bacterium]
MIALSRILKSSTPLTLAGAPAGFLPWLMTDLARAAEARAVFIASDEISMRALAETATWFAPEIEVLT